MGLKEPLHNYDLDLVHKRRKDGVEWVVIAQELGTTKAKLAPAYRRWRIKEGAGFDGSQISQEKDISFEEAARMQTIEDIVNLFELDPMVWEAKDVKVGGSSWHQSVKNNRVAHSVRISATFVKIKFHTDELKEVFENLMARFEDWLPLKKAPALVTAGGGEPMLAVPNLYDSHFGMKVWGREVDGPSQDLDIISSDFRFAAEQLVGMSRSYDVARYLLPLGHDLSHVNQYDPNGKGATTRAGTTQDVDTRLAKIFDVVCATSVETIDMLRATGVPVDVVMVPGNHDPDENYRLGIVLKAWFRHDDAVTITNTPTIHKYYGWGHNSFCLTHGQQYMKNKSAGNPILTFATECPINIWAMSDGPGGCREILSGHFHKRMQGRYTPTSDIDEERGVVTRSLPGLTATDQWHYSQGYRHRRAATLLVYRESGGLAALHETTV